MGSIEYSLFRVKFIRPKQAPLFDEALTPPQVFHQAISERPSGELRAGYNWHVGNLDFFSASSGYFAIGRTTNSKIEMFDVESGNFIEALFEESPYTHCLFNTSIGFVGIAKKPSLSHTTKGIASRLEDLLSRTEVVSRNGLTVEIRPIPDPEGFLNTINEAHRVFRFTATFRGPNPFDADEFFQRPLSVYLSAANGTKGKAIINGEDLDREVITSITRSTAATGNEASARVQKTPKQKTITVNLRGDPIKRKYDEEDHDLHRVLDDLTNLYSQIRHDD